MSEDLIRRSDAIKAIEPYIDYIEIIPLCGAKPYVREAVYGIRSKIKFIPTIEPKRGGWIYGEHDVAMCDGYRCDRCGFFVPWDYEHKSIDFINDYHFCPHCGADMRGKGDE